MDQALEVFLAVVENRGFSRAAEVLHISQPAVSQQIQKFERDLGVTLLERTSKSFRLTKAGDLVYEHGVAIRRLYEGMQQGIHDLLGSPSGPISIGASYTYGEYVLPAQLAEFLREYPGVEPSIRISNTTDIVERVEDGRLDIGVVEGEVHSEVVVPTPLFADEMVVITGLMHPLVARRHVSSDEQDLADAITLPETSVLAPDSLANLSQHVWIVREKGSGTRDMTDAFFAEEGIVPTHLMAVSSTQAIKESVMAGLGITLLSEWAVRNELQWGLVKSMLHPKLPRRRHFTMIRPKSNFATMATRKFAEFLGKVGDGHPSVPSMHPPS